MRKGDGRALVAALCVVCLLAVLAWAVAPLEGRAPTDAGTEDVPSESDGPGPVADGGATDDAGALRAAGEGDIGDVSPSVTPDDARLAAALDAYLDGSLSSTAPAWCTSAPLATCPAPTPPCPSARSASRSRPSA